MQFFRRSTLQKLAAALFSFPLLSLLAVIKHGAQRSRQKSTPPSRFFIVRVSWWRRWPSLKRLFPTSGIIQENKSVRNLNFYRVRVREEVVAN